MIGPIKLCSKTSISADGDTYTTPDTTNATPNKPYEARGNTTFEFLADCTALTGGPLALSLYGSHDGVTYYKVKDFPQINAPSGQARLSWYDVGLSLPVWIAVKFALNGGTGVSFTVVASARPVN